MNLDEESSMLDSDDADASADPEIPHGSETRKSSVTLKRVETCGCSDADQFATSASPLLSSTTLKEFLNVKVPGCNPSSAVAVTPSGYSPGYLEDVNIPSPFLYHGPQHEYVAPANDCQPGWGIPYFEYACGQAQPEPDFTSYRPVTAISQTRPALFKRQESLGTILCAATSSQHRAEASHISDETHDSSTHLSHPFREVSDHGQLRSNYQGCPSMLNHLTNDQLNVSVDPGWSWAEDILKRRQLQHFEIAPPYGFPSTDDTLIYPKMPAPIFSSNTMFDNCSVNNVVHPGANQAATSWEHSTEGVAPFITPDDHCFVREPALPGGLDPCSTSDFKGMDDHHIDEDNSFSAYTSSEIQTQVPAYTALVPVQSYQHRLLTWPILTPTSIPVTKATSPAASEPCRDSSENVLKLCNWLAQLNTPISNVEDGQQEEESSSAQPTQEAVYQCCEDLSTPKSEPSADRRTWRQGFVHPDEEAVYYSEGYATAKDDDSEAELLDLSPTEGEWAYWDWGTDCEDAGELNGEPDHVEDEAATRIFGKRAEQVQDRQEVSQPAATDKEQDV